MLDRIDMQIEVAAVPIDELQRRETSETSHDIRMRVESARSRMIARQGKPNAVLESRESEKHCRLDGAGRHVLNGAMIRLGLSARSYHRTLKVARSIADLAGVEHIAVAHVAEALGYRRRHD